MLNNCRTKYKSSIKLIAIENYNLKLMHLILQIILFNKN